MFKRLRRVLFGNPLATKTITHERLTNSQGLAIFGADALSSTVYATDEILLVLALSGGAAFYFSIPIASIIIGLMLLTIVSYRQVIFAYPNGGGVYNVAKENLGKFPALLGGASLLIDYILTVAVSSAAAVAALTSAFPNLLPYNVTIGFVIIVFLAWGHLRGVRESGKLFSFPTYAFMAAFFGMIGYGFWRYCLGTFPVISYDAADAVKTENTVGIFLLLRAFASGCTAMTGIEATSNGVQAFQTPESENASKTILKMGCILAAIFLGITFLASWARVYPREGETVTSQIARSLFGTGYCYFAVQSAAFLILLLAANAPFAGFPRVASQLARDGYFPKQFLNLGSRLVFANGILFLAGAAMVLLNLFHGSVHALIPLYAVGVFLGFSISQMGMVVHWNKLGQKHIKNIAINIVGCLATSIIFFIVFVTKFLHGAWILIPAVVFLIAFMKSIKRHYIAVENMFALDAVPIPTIAPEKTVIIFVSEIDRRALYALQFVRSFRPAHVRALHVSIDEEEAKTVQEKWRVYVPDVPIDVLVSEYRDLITPILDYLKDIDGRWSNDSIMAVIPEFIPKKFWHNFLHNQTALRLRRAIEEDPALDTEILDVPIKVSTPLRLNNC